jgi:hypothetical protein
LKILIKIIENEKKPYTIHSSVVVLILFLLLLLLLLINIINVLDLIREGYDLRANSGLLRKSFHKRIVLRGATAFDWGWGCIGVIIRADDVACCASCSLPLALAGLICAPLTRCGSAFVLDTTHNDLADMHLELLSGVVGILLLDLLLTETDVDVTRSITLVITEGGCSLKALL